MDKYNQLILNIRNKISSKNNNGTYINDLILNANEAYDIDPNQSINELILNAIEEARNIDPVKGINELFSVIISESHCAMVGNVIEKMRDVPLDNVGSWFTGLINNENDLSNLFGFLGMSNTARNERISIKWPEKKEILQIFLDNGLIITDEVLKRTFNDVNSIEILINYGIGITKLIDYIWINSIAINKEILDFYFDAITKTSECVPSISITNFLISLSHHECKLTLDQIKFLVNMGANPRASNDILFLNSCRKNDLDMINYFLFECGCDVNTHYIDVSGRRKDALIILLESLQDRTIKYLEIGSSVILPNMTENYDTIKKLIDFGIKITDDTILCGLRNPDILSLFLKNGIDPEHIGKLIIDKDLKRNYMYFSALKSLAKIGVDLNQLIINTN